MDLESPERVISDPSTLLLVWGLEPRAFHTPFLGSAFKSVQHLQKMITQCWTAQNRRPMSVNMTACIGQYNGRVTRLRVDSQLTLQLVFGNIIIQYLDYMWSHIRTHHSSPAPCETPSHAVTSKSLVFIHNFLVSPHSLGVGRQLSRQSARFW